MFYLLLAILMETQNLFDQYGCDSTVITNVKTFPSFEVIQNVDICFGEEILGIIPLVDTIIQQKFSTFFGCDSLIKTLVKVNDLPKIEFEETIISCERSELRIPEFENIIWSNKAIDNVVEVVIPGEYAVQVRDANGCENEEEFSKNEPNYILSPDITIVSDYNGWPISCIENSDGALVVADKFGQAPYTYSWSNGMDSSMISNLPAGNYSVTVMDNFGCEGVGSIAIEAPPILDFNTEITSPTCPEDQFGTLAVEIAGGALPYQLTIDEQQLGELTRVDDLKPGSYAVKIVDANGCNQVQNITIAPPKTLTLDLGEDRVLNLGETLTVEIDPSIEIQSVQWMPSLDMDCGNCSNWTIQPLKTSNYKLLIIDQDGCQIEDEIFIRLSKNYEVFIPNIFSPNQDGLNDVYRIFPNPTIVKSIHQFKIFDRWGNLIYDNPDNQSNFDELYWDGRYKNHELEKGVFVLKTDIEFIDGHREIFVKGFTLIR